VSIHRKLTVVQLLVVVEYYSVMGGNMRGTYSDRVPLTGLIYNQDDESLICELQERGGS
jgi:hypothetical protein